MAAEGEIFGIKDKNGTWNGDIGRLNRKIIDLSMLDLTILHDRAQVALCSGAVWPDWAIFQSFWWNKFFHYQVVQIYNEFLGYF